MRHNFEKLGCKIDIYDPYVSKFEVKKEFNIDLINEPEKSKYDVILMAVAHDEFRKISLQKLTSFAKEIHVLYDVKYLLEKKYVDGRL